MDVSIFFVLILILNSVCCIYVYNITQCWGNGNDTSVRPYKIVFSDDMIQDLRQRLRNYRPSAPTFPDVGFEYGFNTRELPAWLNYWANEYPFKQREGFLNQFPQYKTKIQGLDIHFIRVIPVVPAGVEIVPLLLLHGWSGSVREFYEAIPLLTVVSADRQFAVEVIVPSLPGFGFSDAAVRPGLNAVNMAVVLRNLMRRLGHRKFYVQGGDWGGIIGSHIATLFQNEVLGYHTNFGVSATNQGLFLTILGDFFPSLVVEPALADRMYPLMDHFLATLKGSGYLHIQATKPDTLGVGLSDSPAGLLAYILQLMSGGTSRQYESQPDGGLHHYPRDALIDNLMMYWASNSITTSMRIYAESLNKFFGAGVFSKPTKVPTWITQARNEIVYQSPLILKTKYPNLLHTTVLDDGGHYLALELPTTFAHDVLEAIQAFRVWKNNQYIL